MQREKGSAHEADKTKNADRPNKPDKQNPDKAEKPDKRKALIEAARARFREFGISKTSMQEIAEDAGMAVGTVYLYFKNKDDLILGCAERFAENHRASAAKILASKMPADQKLRRYILDRYRAVEETRTGSKFAVEIARRVIKLRPERFEEDDQWLYENILTILREGEAAGLFRSSDFAADARIFVQSVLYFLPVAGLEPYRPPTEKRLIEVIDWFVEKWKGG
jgi:AcrR family transcriptional regulator